MANLKMYLTSLQPNMEQTIYSQSIGGYISNSILYPEATAKSTIGLYDLSFSLDLLSTDSWSDWVNIEYLNINNELMKIYPITNGTVSVAQRGYNNIIETHIYGDIARGVSSVDLFNNVFNDDYKQYRCIAVRNESPDVKNPSTLQKAVDISVYIRQNSRNTNSDIKIAVEKPMNQYLISNFNNIITDYSTGITHLIDTSLIKYPNDYFKNSYLRITGGVNKGQGRVISSFASLTGTFFLEGSLSEDSDSTYEIFPSPAQRIKTGTISPNITESNMTLFFSTSKDRPIRINFSDEEDVSLTSSFLDVHDLFYIWIEKTIKRGSSFFNNNDFVINLEYTNG